MTEVGTLHKTSLIQSKIHTLKKLIQFLLLQRDKNLHICDCQDKEMPSFKNNLHPNNVIEP